jgi:hypothetical protein
LPTTNLSDLGEVLDGWAGGADDSVYTIKDKTKKPTVRTFTGSGKVELAETTPSGTKKIGSDMTVVFNTQKTDNMLDPSTVQIDHFPGPDKMFVFTVTGLTYDTVGTPPPDADFNRADVVAAFNDCQGQGRKCHNNDVYVGNL